MFMKIHTQISAEQYNIMSVSFVLILLFFAILQYILDIIKTLCPLYVAPQRRFSQAAVSRHRVQCSEEAAVEL